MPWCPAYLSITAALWENNIIFSLTDEEKSKEVQLVFRHHKDANINTVLTELSQLENIIDSILEETNNFDIGEIIALLKKVVSIKEYLKQEQINAIKNYLESISFNNNNTQVNEELQIEIKLLLHYFD